MYSTIHSPYITQRKSRTDARTTHKRNSNKCLGSNSNSVSSDYSDIDDFTVAAQHSMFYSLLTASLWQDFYNTQEIKSIWLTSQPPSD